MDPLEIPAGHQIPPELFSDQTRCKTLHCAALRGIQGRAAGYHL